jgi:hypothetical protein
MPRPGFWRAAALAAACLVAPGCSDSAIAPADSAAAHELLGQVLAAWKDGKSIDSLTTADPAITVSDYRWKDGYLLDRYEIDAGDRNQGADLIIKATLHQRDPKGKTRKETAVYSVGIGSQRVVVRNEEM